MLLALPFVILLTYMLVTQEFGMPIELFVICGAIGVVGLYMGFYTAIMSARFHKGNDI